MLNKRRRLFHSSRVKLPLMSMSATWFLESMHLIWIFGSKLYLSNNQSSATLRVRDTCLVVGLLPLLIILITASLSCKKYIAWRQNEKILRLKKHNPHWSNQDFLVWFESWSGCWFVFLIACHASSLPELGLKKNAFNNQVPYIESGNSIHA